MINGRNTSWVSQEKSSLFFGVLAIVVKLKVYVAEFGRGCRGCA